MSAVFTAEFINEQIANLKTQLAANIAASASTQGAQSYSLETGQTRQSVTRAPLVNLLQQRQAILNELEIWEGLLCGTGVLRGTPAW